MLEVYVSRGVMGGLREALAEFDDVCVSEVDPERTAPAHVNDGEDVGVFVQYESDLAHRTLWELRATAEVLMETYARPLLIAVKSGDLRLREMLYGIGGWPLQIRVVEDLAAAAATIRSAVLDVRAALAPSLGPDYSAEFSAARERAEALASGRAPEERAADPLRERFGDDAVDVIEDLLVQMRRTRTTDWHGR